MKIAIMQIKLLKSQEIRHLVQEHQQIEHVIYMIWHQIVMSGLPNTPLARLAVVLIHVFTEEDFTSVAALPRLTAATTMWASPLLIFRSVHFYIVALSPKCQLFKSIKNLSKKVVFVHIIY